MELSLGERIKRWREDSDLTQAALAEQIGISASAVAQWELGETKPTHSNVEKITEALGVSVQTFWGKPPAAKKKKAS